MCFVAVMHVQLSFIFGVKTSGAVYGAPFNLTTNVKLGCICMAVIKHTCLLQISEIARNTKGGSITVLLTSCLTGLESAV
jgi:hypothetical protein